MYILAIGTNIEIEKWTACELSLIRNMNGTRLQQLFRSCILLIDRAAPSLLDKGPVPLEVSRFALPGRAAVAIELHELLPVPARDDALAHPVERLRVGHNQATVVVPEKCAYSQTLCPKPLLGDMKPVCW